MRRVLRVLLRLAVGGGAAVVAGLAVYDWRRRRSVEADPARNLTGAGVPLEPDPRRTPHHVGDAHVLGGPHEAPSLRWLSMWEPARPTGPARLAAYAWAAPLTAAGLLVGATSGTMPTVRDGVLLFAPAGGLAGAVLRTRGFAAGTFGHVVLAVRDPSPALWAHELAHTRQAERLGPLMAPLYLGLLATHGYARHPMERAARRAGRRVRTAEAARSARAS